MFRDEEEGPMLNEDKLKLMTSIAMFEKREGKAIFPANRYFKNDYISSRMLRSFFSYSFCYLLCLLVWVLYSMERILNTINLEEAAGWQEQLAALRSRSGCLSSDYFSGLQEEV